MIIVKIGGTSMGDASRMDKALDIAASQIDKAPLMVCSAMGGITDQIITAFESAEAGNIEESNIVFEAIKDCHYACARDFLEGDFLKDVVNNLDGTFAQFASLLKGVGLLRDCSPRSRDALLSFGERLSTRLIHARARQRGMDSELLDARELVRTDENFTSARPDMEETFRLCRKNAHPEPGRLLITQGFIASSSAGVTTTLGRGGSDYSASILGAGLDAGEIQIWTDVNGIMTSDPRMIPEASTIPEITYEEAGELAFFGAKVVHPATIQPAVAKGIPVLVKNTGSPECEGTRIAANAGSPGLKAISVKKGITVVNIASSRMLEAHGFLRRIFAIFDAAETPVDLVTTSEVSVSVTIEKTESLPEILKKLEALGEVSVETGLSIICMVGRDLWKDPSFPAKAFGALNDIPVRMISLGASEVNLSLVVPSEKSDAALKNLHARFF
ncbi:MAG: lysine-sensitive aspartokinase 3 [Spirochaetes bacterium]|nr:MAG: lysine-sensitive aspartokinase 3 [Spirochaetota bacterium]